MKFSHFLKENSDDTQKAKEVFDSLYQKFGGDQKMIETEILSKVAASDFKSGVTSADDFTALLWSEYQKKFPTVKGE